MICFWIVLAVMATCNAKGINGTPSFENITKFDNGTDVKNVTSNIGNATNIPKTDIILSSILGYQSPEKSSLISGITSFFRLVKIIFQTALWIMLYVLMSPLIMLCTIVGGILAIPLLLDIAFHVIRPVDLGFLYEPLKYGVDFYINVLEFLFLSAEPLIRMVHAINETLNF